MFKNYKRKRIIRTFIKTINKKYKCYLNNTWSSLWTKGKVWYTFKEQEGDKKYLNFIENRYHFRPNVFIISLLHEIGHLETENQELSDERAIEYASLEYAFENNIITREELFNRYFEIGAEMLATNWAVDYYLNNQEQINKLIKELNV